MAAIMLYHKKSKQKRRRWQNQEITRPQPIYHAGIGSNPKGDERHSRYGKLEDASPKPWLPVFSEYPEPLARLVFVRCRLLGGLIFDRKHGVRFRVWPRQGWACVVSTSGCAVPWVLQRDGAARHRYRLSRLHDLSGHTCSWRSLQAARMWRQDFLARLVASLQLLAATLRS